MTGVAQGQNFTGSRIPSSNCLSISRATLSLSAYGTWRARKNLGQLPFFRWKLAVVPLICPRSLENRPGWAFNSDFLTHCSFLMWCCCEMWSPTWCSATKSLPKNVGPSPSTIMIARLFSCSWYLTVTSAFLLTVISSLVYVAWYQRVWVLDGEC